ncbi:MAG: glycosyltransferase family 4 protein [Thermotogota bacterium]|nr:glycosyltransferase family 4 protein [Thermotogota bacterium]
MKILQVSSLFPPHVGGIEHHVSELSGRLVSEGHDVTVYTSNVPKSKKKEIIGGVKIFRFKCIFSPLNNQFIPGLFFRLISGNEFDIIHVHSHLHISSVISVLSTRFRKRPVILTSHGTVEYSGWKNIINMLYNGTIARWLLSSADKIIALSSKQSDILVNIGAKQEDIVVIPNWVDLSKISLNINTEEFLSSYKLNNKKIILFVGGLIPRKGINYLIDSMKHVKSDSILLIIGGEIHAHIGVERLLKEQVKRLGLDNVLFLGRVPIEDLECAYNVADIFVLPSLSEGLPLTLLEAMAYKKCVVATDIPGNSDVIKNNENGILFEVGNSAELAEKIDYLLEDDILRGKMGKNARLNIEDKYSLDLAYMKILDVYKEVQK